MKNITKNGLLLGLGLIGASTFVSTDVSADPQRGDTRDVIRAKQDVQKAKSNLKDAKQDLREERRDRRDDTDDQPSRYNRINNNNRNNYNRNNYNRNNYNRNNVRPVRPVRYTQSEITAVVVRDTDANGFLFRNGNGQVLRAIATNGEPGRLSRGDTVRMTGYLRNKVFNASRVTVLRNRR